MYFQSIQSNLTTLPRELLAITVIIVVLKPTDMSVIDFIWTFKFVSTFLVMSIGLDG